MIKITDSGEYNNWRFKIIDTKLVDCKMYLSKKELESLHTKIGKILNIPDFKKEMGKDKEKFI